jgi:hypothetical protein
MSYKCLVLEAMIASPSDVAECRGIVRDVLYDWNNVSSRGRHLVLLPAGWETHTAPELGQPAQEIINERVLKDCDLLIGIFWTRVGTPTGSYKSGSIEEIQKHVDAGKPAMIYFSSADIPQELVDEKQLGALREFKDWCKSKGLVETFQNPEDFRRKLTKQIGIMLASNPFLRNVLSEAEAPGQERQISSAGDAIEPIKETLSTEAQQLLIKAAQDENGSVTRISTANRYLLRTNGKFVTTSTEPRVNAIWEDAFQQLLVMGMLTPTPTSDRIFKMTKKAYELVDRLNTGR